MWRPVPTAMALCAAALAGGSLLGGPSEADGIAETGRLLRQDPRLESPGVGTRGDPTSGRFGGLDPHGSHAAFRLRPDRAPAWILDGLMLRRWPEVHCETDVARALSVCRRGPDHATIP